MFSSDLLSQMIRFYGNAMQGMMGNYIENNIKSFTEVQAKLKEQAKSLYGETSGENQDLWAQFLKFQGPAMQHMMGAYVEQSQKMFQQMQDTMQEQTRKIFPGIYVKPDEKSEKK
jgi:polyhydroxyalkanoate synthesis regulator protein